MALGAILPKGVIKVPQEVNGPKREAGSPKRKAGPDNPDAAIKEAPVCSVMTAVEWHSSAPR
jgi:hypothetical protein